VAERENGKRDLGLKIKPWMEKEKDYSDVKSEIKKGGW